MNGLTRLQCPAPVNGKLDPITAQNNLNVLHGFKTSKQLLTPQAETFAEQNKEYKVGVLHNVGKVAMPVIAGLGAGGVSTTAAAAAIYYGAAPCLKYLCEKSWSSLPSLSTMSVSGLMYSAIEGINIARGKDTFTISLVKAAIPVVLFAVGLLIFKAGSQAAASVSNSYAQKEKEIEQFKTKTHENIMKEQVPAFDVAADLLSYKFQQAKDSPLGMKLLRDEATKLLKQGPRIKEMLQKELTMLKPHEFQEILNKLEAVLNRIEQIAFDLRAPESEIDNRYNTEMLTVVPNKEFEGKALTNEVKEHIKIAKANTLGSNDVLKAKVKSVGWGVTAGLIVETAIPALAAVGSCFYPEVVGSTVVIASAVIATVPAAFAGFKTAKTVFNKFLKEKEIADAIQAKEIKLANEKQEKIYTGIASSLVERSTSEYNVDKFMSDVKSISEKLPSIKAQVAKTGVLENSITNNLENVLGRVAQAV